MRRRIIVLASLLLLAALPLQAKPLEFEYDYPVVADRWGINLGGFLVDLDTTVAVGFGSFLGSVISLEDILDLEESQKVARLEAFVRLTQKSTLEFGFLQINRDATATISDPFVDFDDLRFSGVIDSEYNISQFKMIYKYSFINNGRVNAGISTGLSWFNLEAKLKGSAVLLDGMGGTIGAVALDETGETLLAPVPSVGMFVQYAAAKWFIVTLEGQFFDLNLGDIDFRFSDTRVVMDFYFTKHVGLGIGFNTTNLEYNDSGENPIKADFRFGGVIFHVGIAF